MGVPDGGAGLRNPHGDISGPAPVMLESEIKEENKNRPVILRPSGMA